VAGEPDPEVRHFFEDLRSEQRVEWLGRIPGEEVPRVLAQSRVGIAFFKPLKNYQEALPTKLFEYMAAGIPFISTDLPFLVNLFDGKDCGIFVDTSRGAGAAAKALRDLLADPDRCAEMGANGRRAIEEEFSFEAEFPNLLSVETAAVRREGAVLCAQDVGA
jgi:glycosyltransferase involved in cell wall biosynthesis